MAASSRLGVLMKLDKNQRKPRIFKASDLCTYNNTIVDSSDYSCCFHYINSLAFVAYLYCLPLEGDYADK